MLGDALRPSREIPDYLKTDLRVGESNQWGVVTVMDKLCEHFALRVFQSAFDLQSDTSCLTNQKKTLSALGWFHSTLADSQIRALFHARDTILFLRGTLAGVEQLAQIYFPGSRARFGRPYPKSRFGLGSVVRLAKRRDRHETIFIRTEEVFSESIVAEFIQNARTLLPLGVEIVVAAPRRHLPPLAPQRLGRIPCHILLR